MTTKNLTLLLALTAATISAGPHQVAAFAPAPSRIQARASISNNNIKQFTVQETLLSAQQQPTNDDDNENGNPVHTSLEQQTDNFEDSMESTRKSTDPASAIEKTFSNVFKSAKTNQAALAAVTMLALAQPLPSNAAMSGGRMGGSFSSPAPRMSTTPRSSGGYSRGYGGGGGYGRGYSSGYATGLGAGYLTAPRIGYSPFAPAIYAPRPYYGGGGIISYSGPNLGQLVFFGGLAFAVSSALKKESPDWSSPLERADGTTSVLGPGNSVIKVSVALEVPNRDDPGSIISVLNRLGQTANTDTRKGVQSLTSQVALEVLRRKSSIVSASTDYQHFNSRSKALREFNNQSTQERGKFERENIGANFGQQSGSKATMAVVTLVLSIDGDSTKVPPVRSLSDVEEALRKISSDAKMDDCLQSVEVLWTPEERTETLSLKDVIADYPTLRSV